MPRRRKSIYDFDVVEQPLQLAVPSMDSSSSPAVPSMHSDMAGSIVPVTGSTSNSLHSSFASRPAAASACSSSQSAASAMAGAIVPATGSTLSSSNRSCASVLESAQYVSTQSAEGGQIVALDRRRQPWSDSRRQVQQAIVAARKRHSSALATHASSLPLVPRQGKQGAWSCDHILHATFPAVRGISQSSAIAVLAGIDESKSKKKHAMPTNIVE